MFRREGFLNLAQIHELIWEECAEDLEAFQVSEIPNFPSVELRKRALVSWAFRWVCDSAVSAFLVDATGRAIEVDAWQVFYPKDPHEELVDWCFSEAFTPQTLLTDLEKLEGGWKFVNRCGSLSMPARDWRNLFRAPRPSDDICRILRPYEGWTVALREGDVKRDVATLGKNIADDKQDAKDSLAYVFDCYCQAFPEGKGTATWAEVQKRVGFSRRSINRALASFGGQKTGQ